MTTPSLDTIETPALVLDIAKVERNIARLRDRLAQLGTGFRPHVKTAKSLDVARRLFLRARGRSPSPPWPRRSISPMAALPTSPMRWG
jgi:D-serine deaminase-like pyridoxal phosphate-dependent protein